MSVSPRAEKLRLPAARSRLMVAAIFLSLALSSLLFLSQPRSARAVRATNFDHEGANRPHASTVSTTIVISEVDADTPLAGTDTANEWFELQNISSGSVTLTNWTITDNNSSDTIPTVTLGPGGHVIVAATAAGFSSEHPGFSGTVLTIADGAIGNGLANGGDALVLKDSSAVVIDGLSWGSNTSVLNPSAGTDSPTNTNQRNAAGTDTDTASDWTRATETPNGNTSGSGSTNPSGVGAANPSAVPAGNSTLLTVNVTPGTSPTSTGITVTGDLSTIGGSATQQFFDDGTNGDVTVGDNVFSFQATVAAATSGGPKTLPISIADAQLRTGSTTISLTVQGPTNPSVTGSANPSTVAQGGAVTLTATVTPGTNPTSSGIAVNGDLTSIGGSATQQFFDDGTNGDAVPNNNVFTFQTVVAGATTTGAKSLPLSVTDAQARSGSGSISLTVIPPPVAPGTVVISQIYGGGGNVDAPFTNDFIEIFNRSNSTVNLAGWSVQYASSGGTSWQTTALSGMIAPGQYYLVKEGAGSSCSGSPCGVALPAFNASGSINMAAASGKVAVVSSTSPLSGSCATGPTVNDFVGYGAANCFEGATAAPGMDNVSADFRTHLGCKDTDSNGGNFVSGAPNPRTTSTPFNVCSGGDFAPEIFHTSPAATESHVPLGSNITIDFDEPVNVTAAWFQISCTSSGSHTATVGGGPISFTLNPDSDFTFGEPCTVTIFASQVTDQDLDDPPDNMAADYVFTFNSEVFRDPAEHLVMGNPNGATADVSFPDNYLMMKTQYALSFNNSRGIPNWTSWHLDSTWRGSAPRQDDFRNDTTLPPSFHQVQGTDYSGSGFDRGHMCPSADRTSTIPDNSATFLMTNMVPQAPGNNQGPWAAYENYLRTFLPGSEIYIVSGGTGTGGVGANGAANTIAGGFVTVPATTWKVALILPVGDNDVLRVDSNTRTIAVIMPNIDSIRPDQWQKYLATVDQVEALSGYDFFSNVPAATQDVFEAKLDAVNDTAPVTTDQPKTTAEDQNVAVTLSATDFNVNNVFTYTIVDQPLHGSVSGSGGNLTYSPNLHYVGPDSFTFKANDGALDSNTSTVSITVTGAVPVPVSMPHLPGAGGSTISVPITVGDLTGLGVRAYDLQVTFNPLILQPAATPYDNAGTLSSGMAITPNATNPGHLIISAFQATDLSGAGTLLNLRFTVVGAPGQSTPLTFEDYTDPNPVSHAGFRFNAGNPQANTTNGSVTVNGPTAASSRIRGQIVSADGGPISGATITVTGGARVIRAITDTNGYYKVENLETGGFYTVTPSRANYTFAPGNRSFSLIADKTDALFTGQAIGPDANPLESPEFFVRQQYLDFLEREPDQGGLDYWSGQLRACGADADCWNTRRIGVSAAFFIEREFQDSGLFIYDLYQGALGRRPAYAEYSVDRKQVVGGATLEAKKQAFALSFVERAEFIGQYPLTLTGDTFVDALLQTAQRSSGIDLSSERGNLVNLYNGGATASESRSLVLRSVAEGNTFKQAQYNPAFVLMEYFSYLGRNPDQGGYDFWLNILNNRQPGNYRGMVCSFITSTEYQKRFSPVITHSNAECGQ